MLSLYHHGAICRGQIIFNYLSFYLPVKFPGHWSFGSLPLELIQTSLGGTHLITLTRMWLWVDIV